MTKKINNCQLEIDVSRGVAYVHSPDDRTLMRICLIPKVVAESEFIDVVFDRNIARAAGVEVGKWRDEWPKEEGMYWFYGWRFGKEGVGGRTKEPELCLVDVRGTAQKGVFSYTTHGHFLYKSGGATGKWQKALLPELPKLEGKD